MRPAALRHLLAVLLAFGTQSALAATVTIEVDSALTQGAVRDLLGVNRRPTFSSQPPGTNYDASTLYAAFGISQIRTHDCGVDLCSIYTAATKTNASVSPPTSITGCTISATESAPHFIWTPTSSADADLDNPANYDFAQVDAAIAEVIAAGGKLYLRLGDSYNGPNDTNDPVAWAKVATNIYRHVIGVFKPTAGVAMDPAYVEVHNEPDGVFWAGTQATFRTLARETLQRVKAAATAAGRTVKLGSAGFTTNLLTTSLRPASPAYNFVSSVGTSNLDFFSTHWYGSCSTATLQSAATYLRGVRSLVNSQGGTALPLHITEWNIGLGEVCGNMFFADQRNQSYTSGVLTLMQDPAQAIEAAHYYAGVPIMALFDFLGTAGTVKVNPAAWAYWAHAKQKGTTSLAAQVCPQDGTCVPGYAAETAALLATASQSGSRQTVVVTNDGTTSVTYLLRVKGLTVAKVSATVRNPPQGVQSLTAGGSPVAVSADAIAALLATVATEVHAGLAVSGGQAEVTLSIPARSVQVVEVQEASSDSVSLAPATLDFGGQSMNTTSPAQLVTITNAGSAAATLTAISASTAFAVTHDCGTLTASLAAGSSCTASVTFTPGSAAALSGSLSVASASGVQTVALSGTGEKSLTTHYYRSILRRAPDSAGKAYWENEASRVQALGVNVNEVWYAMAGAFFGSSEYAAFSRDNSGFVTDLYNTFFNRTPDSTGLAYWKGLLDQGLPREVALAGFLFSTEFTSFTQAIFGTATTRKEIDMVVDFYRGLLGRLPDESGFKYWLGLFRTAQCQGGNSVNTQVESISSQFALGAEYVARSRGNSQYVGDLYNAFLRRGGDLSGVQFWIDQIAGGAQTREKVRRQFVASTEFQARVAAVIAQGCMP